MEQNTNNTVNWDLIFINTLSQDANLFINKKILAKYGLDLAVFISFIANQYNYFLTTNQLTKDKMFFATDDDIFLFTNMPRTRITSIKKQAQKLGFISIKKLGQPVKTYYKVNFEFLVNILSTTATIKELAYSRVLSEENLTENYIKTLSYRDLRLLCKKLSISYRNLSKKQDFIDKIMEEKKIKSSESTNNSTCAEKLPTENNDIPVCGKTANACAEKLPTRVQDFCTLININQANIKSTKTKNHDDELDFFEKLFKEFGINFTKTNKNSILKLRKHLSFKETESYLKETYLAIKENKEVKNIGGLFSHKIAKGERQLNTKQNKKKKEIENNLKNTIEKKIKSKENKKIELVEKYNKLDEYEKLKVEEQALELLIAEKEINWNFLIEIKKKQPILYNSMIKNYIERAMKAQNYI